MVRRCSRQHPGSQLQKELIRAEQRRHLPAGQYQIKAVVNGMIEMGGQAPSAISARTVLAGI
jgi:hypothetical protein